MWYFRIWILPGVAFVYELCTLLWSLSTEINGSGHSKVFLQKGASKKLAKFLKNTFEKVHVYIYFSKISLKLKVILYFWNSGTAILKEQLFFWINIQMFGPNRITFFFLNKISFKMMARQQTPVILKIYQKIKERKLVSENLVRALKSLRVIFNNGRKLLMPRYHSILPHSMPRYHSILPHSNTHLRNLNCK